MIQITQTQLKAYVKNLVDKYFAYNFDNDVTIDDVDDLCDITIESEDICQTDAVFYALYSMLPVIFDDIETYIDENYTIEEDVWGTLAMREEIGLCD